MIVKYLTAQQRLGFGDKKKKEAKTGFYWQVEVTLRTVKRTTAVPI